MEVSTTGLCVKCLERTSESAVKTLELLHNSREERMHFCAELDKREDEEIIKKIFSSAEPSQFDIWGLSIHLSKGQYKRILKSAEVIIDQVDESNTMAVVVGSQGNIYETTLQTCTCFDFLSRSLPCKHMYRLAFQLQILDVALLPVTLNHSKNFADMSVHRPELFLPLEGQTFFLTGVLKNYSREDAGALISKYGGVITSSVSKKTDWVIGGEGAGSKLDKARQLGVTIISEDAFVSMCKSKGIL